MIAETMDNGQMPQNHSFLEPTVSKFKRFDLSQKNMFLGGIKIIQKS